MGATYTRQSSYTDGDVITAAHTNDEFDQLLAAFQASSGHTHSGDANEGGPITKLLGNSLTFGAATAGTDITITFDGETSDGVLAWMEDEDYFKFSDDILIVDDERLIFGTDENIAISYDETTTDSLKIAATEGAGLAITLMADEGDDAGDEWKLNIADGGTLTFGNDIASAGTYVTHLTLTPNATVANSTLAVAGNLTVGGSFTLGSGAVLSEAELEMLDGITAGTVAASKAMVVDSNRDIGTVRNLTSDGVITGASLVVDNFTLNGTELDLSSGDFTLDVAGDIILNTDDGIVSLQDDSTTFGSLENSSGNLVIKSGTTTAVTFSGANTTFAGTVTIGSAEISEAELEILDGANVTTAELNILDGDTSATSTTVSDADRVVFNKSGSMRQVAVTDLAAYFDDEITAMPNLTSVGTLTTLTVDNVIINGSTIGHTSDPDLITVASGVLTVAGEVDATSLDISGDADIDGTLEADAITIAGVTLAETISDTVGAMVGSNTETGIGVTYDDSDNTLDFVIGTAQTTIESVKNTSLVVGRDDDNLIKFSTDNQIIFEVSGGDNVIFKASGEIEATELDISGDVDVDGTTNLDNTDIDGTLVVDGSNISLDSTSTLNIDNSNTSNGITIGTATSGVPISIGHTTSEVTVNDNLTVTGDLTVSGTTTTVNSTTVNLNDHNIVLDSGNSTSAVINGAGITIEGGSGDDATFSYNTTGPKFELKLGSSHEDLQ